MTTIEKAREEFIARDGAVVAATAALKDARAGAEARWLESLRAVGLESLAAVQSMPASAVRGLRAEREQRRAEQAHLGANVCRLREEQGLEFSRFARLAGIDHKTLRKIESGKGFVRQRVLRALAAALKVTTPALLAAPPPEEACRAR